MFNEKFKEVLKHEGAVSVCTWADGVGHVSNTWNSYVRVPNNTTLLIPAAGMVKTQANIEKNEQVKLTLGTKEVQGHYGPGAGFLIEGTAKFVTEGEVYDQMKAEMPFMTRVLEVKVSKVKQTV